MEIEAEQMHHRNSKNASKSTGAGVRLTVVETEAEIGEKGGVEGGNVGEGGR